VSGVVHRAGNITHDVVVAKQVIATIRAWIRPIRASCSLMPAPKPKS
jgi:hypothetical protein